MGNRPAKTHSSNAWREGSKLAEGFTTGACAAASARAAVRALITGRPVSEITIDLPARKGVTFQLARCDMDPDRVTCGTVKDAGDDPDVTHGAEIQATVEWVDGRGVSIEGGQGVGVVTKPGLFLPIGEPAINMGPRQMITREVAEEAGDLLEKRGLRVTVSVPCGEGIAQETINPRLGIVGGISILGTTGIVKPYSQPAYRASIHVELKVAAANGVLQAVLSTGNRSEEYARRKYPDWPDMGFVQVGDHIGYALKQARRLGFTTVVITGMIGKLSKLAQGRAQTHVSEGGVDLDFLGRVAGQLGADDDLMEQIRCANTARHVQVMMRHAAIEGLEQRLAEMSAARSSESVDGSVDVEVLLFDIKGGLLGESHMERST